ncbi:MAG: 2'-5' RNA ligase family protein [Dehalococcoidales bacterium]
MASYFIEVRIMGSMKHEIRTITYDVRKNCHLRGSKPIPHISIVSNPTPLNPRQDEKKLLRDFSSICSQYPVMELQFDGFGSFPCNNSNGVAKINIKASQELLELRWDLISRLKSYCQLDRTWDAKKDYYCPHITIAMNLNQNQLNKVMSYLRHQKQPYNHHFITRVTLLKNHKLLSEYDFFLKRTLTRNEALSRTIEAETNTRIRRYLSKNRTPKPDNKIKHSCFESLKNAIRKFIRY